ncbi:MAG: hypothetical protein PWP57_1025 [Candidatus Atribacteria bacterium]|nr:hypothetical protein [Candidatus Atribacteria bacterium]
MRKYLVLSLAVLLVFGLGTVALAANTATQTVTYQVDAINEISVSGDPSALTVSTATAGSEPDAVTDNSTTYAITTNETSKKITGAIDTAMPTGLTLEVNLAAPTAGGTSAGDVALSATAADLVTGIAQIAESGLGITYTLSATVAAGVVTSATKTVTLTLTDAA